MEIFKHNVDNIILTGNKAIIEKTIPITTESFKEDLRNMTYKRQPPADVKSALEKQLNFKITNKAFFVKFLEKIKELENKEECIQTA